MIRNFPKLNKGDTIALIAPSFGCTTEPYFTRLNASIKRFEKEGYKIKLYPNVYLNEGVCSSNSPILRAKEFMDAYLDKEVKAIFSVGGGELMCEILPFIDFELIKNNEPKAFVGFSDNTNLTYLLTILADVKTIYGPNAPSFYEKPWRLNEIDTIRLLEGEKEFVGYNKWSLGSRKNATNPLEKVRYNRQKIIKVENYNEPFTGTLLGGCLDIIDLIRGTKFDKTIEFIDNHPEGIIWYLESCDFSPLDIRRAIFSMKEAGYFKNVKGFMFGRHLCQDTEILGVNKYNAVLDLLKEYNVPILFDVDLGHLPPSMPIKNGGFAEISIKNNNIYIKYLD